MASKVITARSLSAKLNAIMIAELLGIFLLLDLLIMGFDVKEAFLPYWNGSMSAQDFAQVLIEYLQSLKVKVIAYTEIFLIIWKLFGGHRGIKRVLKPVDQMSELAKNLSVYGKGLEEEQLHALEDAIEKISPSGADETQLKTGNRELEGLEGALNDLVKRMRDSYQQQARFVSDASHELRTPIAVIKGYADMLDRWGKSDETVLDESVKAIKSESENMSYLIEQLLFLARGDSGRTKLNKTRFDLSELMNEVFEESTMIDENHNYHIKTGGVAMLSADASLVKQASRILIDNAAKYTPEGEDITIKAGVDGNEVWFAIQDSGVGISANDIPHLFERFYRADNSRTRQTGGTGLGLAIAKWIVDRHGGRFDVVSFEEIGTRITVYLPRL